MDNPSAASRTVLVFGVFDGIHEGHRSLFRQAKSYGDRLVVAVAQGAVVARLKGEHPRYSLDERIARVSEDPLVDRAVAGDTELGAYTPVTEHCPDVVVLGYDQKALGEDLALAAARRGWKFSIIFAAPHEPETYHNRILRRMEG